MESAMTSPAREEPEQAIFRHRMPAMLATLLLVVSATLGAYQFRTSISPFAVKPFGTYLSKALPAVEPSASAFGESGGVLMRFAMPGAEIAGHGGKLLPNYEGLSLGPRLPDGRRILFVISDDNATPELVARVLVLAIKGIP